jgi:NAD(P)-dependent dehydrogenase (short-subunit alcohol dehydrogenase family)
MQTLRDRIAIVTGASRGGGKGIAMELGAAGCTVYVTGRSARGEPPPDYGEFLRKSGMPEMPGTIDDTADAVTAAGGRGIAVRCDHTDRDQVSELFARVEREHGRLDVLVNNAWGGHESFDLGAMNKPFWEQTIDHWTSMFDHGVRNHVLAAQLAAPMLVTQKRGLVVTTTFWDRDRYLKGNMFYDLAKATMNRLAFDVAEELRSHGVASIALAPGWMRTELVLAGHKATETTWHEHPSLTRTESTRYIGRAVAALAADDSVLAKTGKVLYVGDLASEYGFTDIDGRVVPRFEI